MSNRVSQIVRERSQHRGVTYAVLLAIADRADDDGRAFPSLSTLAIDTRSSRRQVVTAIITLTQAGELARASGNRLKSNRYSIQIENLLAKPQRYPKKAREVTSLPTLTPREASSLPPREATALPDPKVGKPLPQGREATALYPSLNQEIKKETAPLRGADCSTSSHESESEVPFQNHQADTPGHDTPVNEMAHSGPDKTKTAPPTYKHASASKRVTISAMREIDGFPPHRVIDLWNGLAETAGLKPFVEQLDDRMRLRILKRQHEKPDPDWWASKLRDVSRHKWSVEVHGVTLSYLLAESGWQKLCGGEYAPKPPAPRRLSL